MEIKKQNKRHILNGVRVFEITNNLKSERGMIYKIYHEYYFLEHIDCAVLGPDEDVLESLDSMFINYNRLTAKDNLTKKQYEWIENNVDYFLKNNAIQIHRWVWIGDEFKIQGMR